MFGKHEIMITLHGMAMKGELSTAKKIFKSDFDDSIQFTLSEYEKAIKFVKQGTIPSWLKDKIAAFREKAIL